MSAPILQQLLVQNKGWVAQVLAQDPNFFKRTAEGQYPKVLWIGCSDSRVPESVILGCMPGDIFAHRNIANQIPIDDYNVQSVLTYAVAELGVEHIVVGGHTRCGGVAVCLDHAVDKAECFNPVDAKLLGPTDPRETASWPPPPPLDEWLAPLRKLALSYPTPPTVLELVKANIAVQVKNVVQSPVVQAAWKKSGPGRLIGVHGWMYNLETGYVEDLGLSIYAPSLA